MAKSKVENEIEVKRASEIGKGKDKIVFVDLIVNGVTIYGCKIVDGKKGEFVAFPSRKSDKDGKYYNYAWVDFSEEETEQIIKDALKML